MTLKALRFAEGGVVDEEEDADAVIPSAMSTDVSAAGGLSALDMPGAAEALATLAKSSAEARAALTRARQQIAARKYNRAIPLLAASAALGAPTRAGSSAESFAAMSGALINPLREKDQFEREQQKDMLGVDSSIAGLDQNTATAQLQLAMLRARLNNDAAKTGNDVIQNPDGTYGYASHADARKPGVQAPAPSATNASFQFAQMPLPDGTSVPVRFNARTGAVEPVGEPYRPKLGAAAGAQMVSKLQTTQVLKAQMEDVREKWKGVKDTVSAGYLQGWVPSEAGKQFDKAVAAMKGTIRQLTRVPGEGSTSDWEGKLDQAKLPDRGDYESVTEQSFDQIEKLINAYEGATKDVLGMNTPAPPSRRGAPMAPAAPGVPRVIGAAPTALGGAGPVPVVPAATRAAQAQRHMQLNPSERAEAAALASQAEPVNPDDTRPAVQPAPPEALKMLEENPDTRDYFLKTFGYLPHGY